MKAAGVFDSARGGRMDMILTSSTRPGQYDGRMKITDTRVKNANTLADLLAAISVIGLLEQLSGEGISFNDVSAIFVMNSAGVQVKEASAVGASLGLTMAGNYIFGVGNLDMHGVITPIYMLNGLLEQTGAFGGLFGNRRGEGLFGFNYTLRGTVDNPSVGVNPLSLLTPGMFREIFRQPMPKLPE